MMLQNFRKLQRSGFEQKYGSFWLRTLLSTVIVAMILGTSVLAHATKAALDAADWGDQDEATSTVASRAYGTQDPYGFGPRANAGQDAPGGGADQERLSSIASPEPSEVCSK